MPIIPAFNPATGASGGPTPGGGGSDLTAPAPPAPVNLSNSATSLGSTLIGSWSASVTVTASVTGSDGSAPTATVTGSGAGPYSVSIASGLTSGTAYTVRLRGTGSDGQIADVTLLVRVGAAMGWREVIDYDFTGVDTQAAVTATGGTIALTVGGSPLVTLQTITGSGTGSITPTNGTGIIFSASGGGIRNSHIDVDWAGLGIDPYTDTIAIQALFSVTSIVSGGVVLPMMHSSGSSLSSNFNFGVRWALNSTTYSIAGRFFNTTATIDTALQSGTTPFSGDYGASMELGPGGQTIRANVGGLALPPSMGLGPRRYVNSASWGTTLTYPAGPPRPAFGVQDSTGVLKEVRVLRWGV